MAWSRLQTSLRSQSERNIVFLFLDTISQGVLAGGIISFIPVFVVRLGGSSLLVSLLTALPALGIILFSLPAAALVTRRTNMVRVTVQQRIIYHALVLLIGLAPFVLDRGLAEVVVILWALQAFPAAMINVAWTEVIAHAVPVDQMGRVNGARWAIYSVVIAASSAGFGALLQRLPLPVNYQIVFFASFLSGVVSTYFFSRIRIPDGHPAPRFAGAGAKERLRRLAAPLIESPSFRAYQVVGFLIRLGIGLPVALYSIFWVNTLQASDQLIGWRTTAGSLALVVGYAFWGRKVASIGYRRGLAFAGIGMALYPGLTALVPAPPLLIPVALVWGFFASGIDINIFEGLLRISPAQNRTSYVAMNTIIANLAVFLGPLLGSLLSNLIGIRLAFVVALLIGVAGALLARFWRIEGLQSPATPAPPPPTEIPLPTDRVEDTSIAATPAHATPVAPPEIDGQAPADHEEDAPAPESPAPPPAVDSVRPAEL